MYRINNILNSGGPLRIIMICVMVVFVVHYANATSGVASVSGPWSSNATWGGSAPPTNATAVTINPGVVVTADATTNTCASLTISASSAANTGLTIGSGYAVTVGSSGTGAVTITAPSGAYTSSIAVGAGTLTCGAISIGGGAAGKVGLLSISTGTVTCTSVAFSGTAAQAQLTFSGAGLLQISGSSSLGSNGTFTSSNGTVNFSGASQSIPAYAYGYLTLSGSGTPTLGSGVSVAKDLNLSGSVSVTTSVALSVTGSVILGGTSSFINSSGATTIGSNLTIGSGTTFQCNVTGFSVSGVTSVSGTLQINAGTTKTFSGLITVNSGGVLQMMGGSPSPTTATYSYASGSTLLYSGAATKTAGSECPSTIPDGVTLEISNTSTVTFGTITIGQGTSGTLEIFGNAPIAVTSLTYASGSTLLYAGAAAKTVGAEWTNPTNVTIDNSSGVVLGAAKSLPSSGVLTLTSGLLTTTAANLLTLNNTSTSAISGGSSSSYISGPVLLTLPSSLGSGSTYLVPVGSATQYLPISIINPVTGVGAVTITVQGFTASTGGSVDATLSSKSTTEYWSISSSGNFTNSTVSITPITSVGSNTVVGWSSTLAGSYTNVCGAQNGNTITSEVAKGGSSQYYLVATSINPVTAATAVQTAQQGLTLSWTAATGYSSSTMTTLVFLKASSAITQGNPNANPVSYTSSTTLGSGTAYINDPSAYCIYSGSGTSVAISGLTEGTTYYALIYTVLNSACTGSNYTYSEPVTANVTIANPNILKVGTSETYTSLSAAYAASVAWDIIDIDPGTYSISSSPEVTITHSITIKGSSAASTIFVGNVASDPDAPQGYYFAKVNAPGITVNFENMTLEEFDGLDKSDANYSNCIWLASETSTTYVNFTDVNFSQNGNYDQQDMDGGNMYSYGLNTIYIGSYNNVTMNGVGNTCNGTLSFNPETPGGALYNAGGIGVDGSNISLTINNSVFSGNIIGDKVSNRSYAGSGGAGINKGGGSALWISANCTNSTNVYITNSVFSNNYVFPSDILNWCCSGSASGIVRGGAIYMNCNLCTLSLINSVIDSSAIIKTYGGPGSGNYGSAICIDGGIAYFRKDKIFANNIASSVGTAYGTMAIIGGGGATSFSTTATIDSCYFYSNGNTQSASDLYIGYGTSIPIIASCSNNLFSSSGTNIYAYSTSGNTYTVNITDAGTPSTATTIATISMSGSQTYTPTPAVPTYTGNCANTDLAVYPLPISLVSFTGVCTQDGSLLMWQTATQTNNQRFEIQRSSDGRIFTTIAEIEGAGTTTQTMNYNFIDTAKLQGITYYRLKQVDYDGKTSQSQPIPVDHSCLNANDDPGLKVYPNPSNGTIWLELKSYAPNTNVEVQLFNNLGKVVKDFTTSFEVPGIQATSIDLSNYTNGMYYVRIFMNDKTYFTKVMKN